MDIGIRGVPGGPGRTILTLGVLLLGALAPTAVSAQTPLTLADAMGRARTEPPAARAAAAGTAEASERVREARSGYFPRVDVSEAVQRGDQPVYVFSSLLSQRRFTAANFAIPALNDPSPLTNTRTSISVMQPIFNGGRTRLAVDAASLQHDVATADAQRATQDLAIAAAAAFVGVLQLEASERAITAAVAAAEEDLRRARDRRDVGIATDADVLAVEVHLADMRQRRIAAAGDLEVGRLRLRQAVGLPADAPLTLVAPTLPEGEATSTETVAAALERRPEHEAAQLREALAANAVSAARAAFLPTVGVQAGWDFNGSNLTDQRSGWIVGAEVQLSIFRGFGDAARLAAARHRQARAAAEREHVARDIEIGIRAALVRLETARAREAAGRAAVAQAQESQRIVRDRYDTGLAPMTDVLRAAEAVLDAEAAATAARLDVILRSVELDRARGVL